MKSKSVRRQVKSSYRLVDFQMLRGNVHEVNYVPSGPTNSAAITTTMHPLRPCGGQLSVAVTQERRYSPRADYALTTTTMSERKCATETL